jgi:hypothetical protein
MTSKCLAKGVDDLDGGLNEYEYEWSERRPLFKTWLGA